MGDVEVEIEEPGEDTTPKYPIPVDIDDGIKRDVTIKQEIFGIIFQYGSRFEVMRFTLKNSCRDAVRVQVSSLGAALTSLRAPDRKGVKKDIVLGFDSVEMYYCPLNPGFGRITSLCPLPYNLEKIVWDWDFDRDDGSVTFSTAFYKIDLVLSVRYKLTNENELIVDMKACGSKIIPISLTNQVYWNLAGHEKGETAMQHHVLSVNSDRLWKHYNHKLKNFIPVNGTKLDFRMPTIMNNPLIFGDKNFEHVFVVSKGCKQRAAFLARLIHPRSCRYVEVFSDQPWMLCNTLNKMPRELPRRSSSEFSGEGGEGEDEGEGDADEASKDITEGSASRPKIRGRRRRTESSAEELPFLEEIPGKDGAYYEKYGSFCITPVSDLTGFDPIVRAGQHYSHRLVYKLGVYRRYNQKPKPGSPETPTSPRAGLVDIKKE